MSEFYREVVRYQTLDGKLHESPESAENHIVKELENMIGPIIDEIHQSLNPKHSLTLVARLAIVERLVGSPDRAVNLRDKISKLV